jgi:tetratricopeptide (TPR) repeat protein
MKHTSKAILFCLLLLLFFQLFADSKKYFKIYQKIDKANRSNDTSLNNYFLKLANHKAAKTWDDYTLKFRIYSYLKMYDLAVFNIGKAIEINPSMYVQYLQKADCYRVMTKYDSALIEIQIALNLDSISVPVIYHERGLVFYELGRYKDALKDFDNNITLSHNVIDDIYAPASRVYKSKCNYFLGNFDDAIHDLDFKKNDTAYYGKYATFERGKIFFTQKNIQAANSEFNAFISKSKDSLEIGLANAYLGDKEKALSPISKYESKNTENKKSEYYAIARIYAVLKDKENALKYIALSLENGYNRFEYMKSDYDLINIHNTPEFYSLIQKYQTDKQK